MKSVCKNGSISRNTAAVLTHLEIPICGGSSKVTLRFDCIVASKFLLGNDAPLIEICAYLLPKGIPPVRIGGETAGLGERYFVGTCLRAECGNGMSLLFTKANTDEGKHPSALFL